MPAVPALLIPRLLPIRGPRDSDASQSSPCGYRPPQSDTERRCPRFTGCWCVRTMTACNRSETRHLAQRIRSCSRTARLRPNADSGPGILRSDPQLVRVLGRTGDIPLIHLSHTLACEMPQTGTLSLSGLQPAIHRWSTCDHARAATRSRATATSSGTGRSSRGILGTLC